MHKSFKKSLTRLQSNFLVKIKDAAMANTAQSEVTRAIKTSAMVDEEAKSVTVKQRARSRRGKKGNSQINAEA